MTTSFEYLRHSSGERETVAFNFIEFMEWYDNNSKWYKVLLPVFILILAPKKVNICRDTS